MANIIQTFPAGAGSGVPAGGTTGQALVKKSATDRDVEWQTINSIPDGGTTGQVLAKKSNTNKDVEWKNNVTPGHTIKNSSGTDMTQRANLEFDGLNVTDDSSNSITKVAGAGLNSDSIDDIAGASLPSAVVMGNGFNYSTTEQIVGRWIDGKPLYQKTVNIGTLPNNSNKKVAHGVSNIGDVIDISGYATGTSGNKKYTFNLPNVGSDASYSMEVTVQDSEIVIVTKTDRT